MKSIVNLRKAVLLLLFSTLFYCINARAQQQTAYLQYINKYSSLAIDQMNRHRIPASITLAQGLLESAAGRSMLAVEAHNHFGIKVGTGWDGPFVLKDDDARNERFRKYKSDAQSYEDHSLFLKKPRYASLFQLDITDYRGWARGLKACGYATSPTYAESLIRIIENYRLYEYDGVAGSGVGGGVGAEDGFFATHPVRKCNGKLYVVLLPGDNLASVARMTGVSKRKLLSYNDLPRNAQPSAGSVIFLEKKRTKADKAFKHVPHIMQAGQSLYDVSQLYGIRLKSLYKMNHFTAESLPQVGQAIRIR